jgi:hypothetical protein
MGASENGHQGILEGIYAKNFVIIAKSGACGD